MSIFRAKPQIWWPGINYRDSLSQGLIFATPMWLARETTSARPLDEDLVTREISSSPTVNGGAWRAGTYGLELYPGTGINQSPFWNLPFTITQELSFFIFCGPAGTGFDRLGIVNDTSAATRGLILSAASAPTTFNLIWNDAIGSTTPITGTSWLRTTDDNVAVGAIHDGGAGDQYCAAVVNGHFAQSTSWTTRNPSMSRVRIGGDGAGSNAWDTAAYAAAVWGRILGVDEMYRLITDPFVLYRKPSWVPQQFAGISVAAGHPTMRRWAGVKHMPTYLPGAA